MQKAYLNLVKFALKCGYKVSVYDGEEWQVCGSTGYQEIVDAIESVEEADLVIRTQAVGQQGSARVAWAKVSAFGLEPDETVMDYSCTSFMEDWENQYQATCN